MKITLLLLAVIAFASFILMLINVVLLVYWIFLLIYDFIIKNEGSTYTVRENIEALISPWYLFKESRLSEKGGRAKLKVRKNAFSAGLYFVLTFSLMFTIELIKKT